MKDIKLFLLATLMIIGVAEVSWSQGHTIQVNVDGITDTTLIMGNFFGERTYVNDTAFSSEGKFLFSGNESLPKGMYFIAAGKTRIFDFIIYDDQEFTLSTSGPDYLENMTVAGGENNTLFVEDMRFNRRMNMEAAPYITVLQDSTASPEDKQKAEVAVSQINQQVQQHQNEIINSHPESFLAKIFNAQRKVAPPEDESNRDEAIAYYKKHYWDYFDLADPMFLRLNLPIYREKVNNYLDRLHIQHPDSLKPAIDFLAQKASANEDTYKYLIWMLTLKYQNPTIMGLDELYVYLYDTYFASGEMDYWANEQLKQNLGEFASQLRNSLIGVKAPNMIMLDENLQRKNMYDINTEYTILYFFDPDCHHCKLATPVLDKIYDSGKFDLQVYAVSTDTSMVKMKEYILEMGLDWITVSGPRTETPPYHTLYDAMTTPTIYILDREKMIIAKKLPVERVDEFLTRYEGVGE